jgi:hypothetical protein
MEQLQNAKPEYPPLLKVLLAVGVLFLGALGILFLSIILSMVGFVYGINNILDITIIMEQMGLLMLGSSIILGGGISIIGLTLRSVLSSGESNTQHEKQKNENRTYDIRDYGLSVEDVLSGMSMQEREYLADKLRESRLAIRDDGTLIPLEQAEKMVKIERFIDG